MANTLQPQDVYALVNEVVLQATGRQDIQAVDTSSFVSVGETLLRTSAENTLNAISTVLARTVFSVRPYNAKLAQLLTTNERWGAMVRKVVTLPGDLEASKDWNTQLGSPLTDGQSVDMYTINKPKVLQLNFYGTKVLQKHITMFRDQLSLAFTSEAEFSQFIDAIMTQVANDIELANENERRATLINYIGGISSMGLAEVDLTQQFNTKFGTTYTRDELLSTHLTEFMKFFAATVKTYSARLTDNTATYHANITGVPKILRHTPKDKQRMFMYEPMFIDAEASVYSALFNPQYLNIGAFEGVNFWQAETSPTAIKVTPNILDVSDGTSKTAENAVELDYVVGLLYDIDALGVNQQFEYTATTPFNAAGGYSNTYYHWRFNHWNDFTENAVLFVMGEGGAE